MKAKRLPSGSYRALAYSHTDQDGKRHYESFTAPTRAEAEMKAAEFSATKKRRARHDLTVAEAVEGYIKAKEGVLSPSTIRSYYNMMPYYKPIGKKRLRAVTSEEMQMFISGIYRSPKTVSNVYGLLSSTYKMYAPDISFNITLPAKKKRRPVSPSENDIRAVYNAASPKMKLCIALAMCGFRRGEICALKYEDIKDGIVHVHADMVKDKESKWVYKDSPKERDSDRFFVLPAFVLDLIGDGTGFIVDWTPDSVTKRFIELRDSLGYKFTFHDIRHFFASIGAGIMPDVYLADLGGWARGSNIMKSVYQNAIPDTSEFYARMMADRIGLVIGDAARNATRK